MLRKFLAIVTRGRAAAYVAIAHHTRRSRPEARALRRDPCGKAPRISFSAPASGTRAASAPSSCGFARKECARATSSARLGESLSAARAQGASLRERREEARPVAREIGDVEERLFCRGELHPSGRLFVTAEHVGSDVMNGEGPGARHDPLRPRERDRVERFRDLLDEPPQVQRRVEGEGNSRAVLSGTRARDTGRSGRRATRRNSSTVARAESATRKNTEIQRIREGSGVMNAARGPRPKLAISQARWGRGRRPSPPRHTGMTHREAFRLLELRTLV